jgi:hypothetical protein
MSSFLITFSPPLDSPIGPRAYGLANAAVNASVAFSFSRLPPWNLRAGRLVFPDMRTIPEIHAEIERLSEVRGELWQQLSYGRDQAVVDEIKLIDEQLVTLWDEHRAERARIRFGERDDIVRRARQEERLERAA